MIHPLLSIQARFQNFTLKNFKRTRHGRYLKKIHNSQLGKCCFIVGNGPSLTAEDLTTLHEKGIDTFAVNRIYRIFSQTPWRPTYYVSTDPILVRDMLPEVNALPTKHKFIPLQNKYYHNIKVRNAHYFFRNDLREKDQPEGFSLDCTDQVNTCGTVTIACIQLAMHMGYRHIYLLGIDHNYDKVTTESGEIIIDPSVKNYFCEGYDEDVIDEVVHDLGTSTRSYRRVSKFCRNHGVQVINCTRTTKLQEFDCANFDEIMEKIDLK